MSDPAVTIDGTDIAAASLDGVGVIDGDSYTYANDALAEIHGYDTPEEIVGKEWPHCYSTDSQDFTACELLERVCREDEWRGSAIAHGQNNSKIPVELSLRATDSGVVCVVRERTDKNSVATDHRNKDYQPRQRIHSSLGLVENSQNLLDALADVIYVVDDEDNIVAWNSQLNQRLGYTDEEIVEMNLADFLPEEYRGRLGEAMNMVDFPDRTREMDVVTKDGDRIPHEFRGVTYTNETSGERYRVGVAHDITERRECEQQLERYETILETVQDGVYVLDENFRFSYVNNGLCEMTEKSRDELIGMLVIDLFEYDDEIEAVNQIRQRITANDTSVGSIEGTLPTSAGERTLEARFRLHPEPQGEYRGSIGIVRDVTERREREQQLRTTRKFNEELVENAPFGMFRLDEDLRITYENPRAEEIIGLPDDKESSDAIGVDIRDLPSIVETGQADLFTDLKNGETIEFEFPFESIYGKEAYFTGRGVPLYQEEEFTGAVLMANDISERRQQERNLEQQRDELDTLNKINELLLAISRDLFESPREREIEQTVCARLADSDLYQFAWIGRPEVDSNRLIPIAVAGLDDDYVDSVTVTIDESETGQGPGGRAFRTGEIQVSQNVETDPTFEPWREAALDRDIRSAAAVPLAYDDTTYGILAVYASRPLAFSRRERRGFEILGEAIGYAINATRTRQLLFAERVTELEIQITDSEEFVIGVADRLGCQLSLNRYVAAGEGKWLFDFSLLGENPERFAEAANKDPTVETVRTIENGDEWIVVFSARSSLLDTITVLGGQVTSGSIENGRGSFVLELPQSADINEFIEQVRSTYPETEFVAKRNKEPRIEESLWLSGVEAVDLTDRQLQTLEVAFRAGYFEWPRENSANAVADLLDISRPTLQAHLRKAEKELVSTFFSNN